MLTVYTHLAGQDHLKQVAQGHVQMDFESLQSYTLYNLTGLVCTLTDDSLSPCAPFPVAMID